jgi:hypothetical protein
VEAAVRFEYRTCAVLNIAFPPTAELVNILPGLGLRQQGAALFDVFLGVPQITEREVRAGHAPVDEEKRILAVDFLVLTDRG